MKNEPRRGPSRRQHGANSQRQARPTADRRASRLRLCLAALAVAVGVSALWWFSRPAPAPVDSPAGDMIGESDALPQPLPTEPGPETPETAAPLPTTVPALMEAAEDVVMRLIRRYPDDPYAFDCAAKAELYLGRASQAAEYWTRSLELDPKAAFAEEGLGRVAAMQSEYEQAVKHFRRAIQLRPELSDKTWLADTSCQLADMLTKLGKTQEAMAVLEQNVHDCPQSARSHLLLGQLLLQSRKFKPAAEQFEEAVRLDPDSSEAHFGLATALRRTGDQVRSAEAMKTFQKLREQKTTVRTRMKFQEAEPKELAGKVAMTYTHAGQIYAQHGDLPSAQRHWQRANQLNDRNATSRSLLASCYVQTNRPEEALAQYNELISIDPDNPLHYWQSAILCVQLRRWESAEAGFRKVVELSPDSSRGYAALAELYLRTGKQLDEARRCAEQAVHIDPVAQHYLLLSRVCTRLGDEPAARQAAAKARESATRDHP